MSQSVGLSPLSPTELLTPTTLSMTPECNKAVIKVQDLTKPRTEMLSVLQPVKKRKSWGQQLPDPKTNLAPRKRAKTDDEKEQRRVERIKRNRAAAHTSRERKRVEAEHLATANDILVSRIQKLERQLARQDVQLEKCKQLLPQGLPEVPEDDSYLDCDDYSCSTPTSHIDSVFTMDPRASIDTQASSFSDDDVRIKTEDSATSLIQTCDPFMTFEQQAQASELDPTQHSAAMLCDLQCRSSQHKSLHLPLSTLQLSLWTRHMIFLTTHLAIMAIYKTCLMCLWTQSPERMNRLCLTLPRTSRGAPRLPTCSILTLQRRILTLTSETMQPRWLTLAQLLFATGPYSTASSAPALDPVRRRSGSDSRRRCRESKTSADEEHFRRRVLGKQVEVSDSGSRDDSSFDDAE